MAQMTLEQVKKLVDDNYAVPWEDLPEVTLEHKLEPEDIKFINPFSLPGKVARGETHDGRPFVSLRLRMTVVEGPPLQGAPWTTLATFFERGDSWILAGGLHNIGNHFRGKEQEPLARLLRGEEVDSGYYTIYRYSLV
jgi:hypothetical protein